MSELQMALFGLGGLLVLAVWGYTHWQDRQHRKNVADMLPEAPADALMAGRETMAEREPVLTAAAPPASREPTLGGGMSDTGEEEDGAWDEMPEAAPRIASGAAHGTTTEAVSDTVAMPASAPAGREVGRPVPSLPEEWADGRVDCVLQVEFIEAVPLAALAEQQATWSATLGKPLQWFALEAGNGQEQWNPMLPAATGRATHVAAALQLADRQGALDAATLDAFLDGMHRLAVRFAGLIELPERATVLEQARQLDEFCAAIDLQLTLQVVPRTGSLTDLVGARLVPVIESAALRPAGERLLAMDAAGREEFSLVCRTAQNAATAQPEAAALASLSFGIDVPRVGDGVAAFEHMLACARQCADALGGQLVDSHRKPVADGMIAAIRKRISELDARMTQAGITPGGTRALRLFA